MNIDIEKIIMTALQEKATVHITDAGISIWMDAPAEEPKPEKKAPDPRKQNNVKELDMGKVKALRNAGWSYSKIADEMGVSVATISNRLKEGT